MPCRHNQSTISGVLWPAKLSHTSSSRNGGSCSGRVKRTARSSCHTCHAARIAMPSTGLAAAGKAATISAKLAFSQPCRTTFVPLAAGWTRT